MTSRQATRPDHFLKYWRVAGMPGEDPYAQRVGYDEGYVNEEGEPSRVQLLFADGASERFTPHELFPPTAEDMRRYRRELKAMEKLTVLGFEITDEIESAVINRMKASEFTAAELEDVVIETAPKAWVEHTPSFADRVADRLIQRERKAGNIDFTGVERRWRWQQA